MWEKLGERQQRIGRAFLASRPHAQRTAATTCMGGVAHMMPLLPETSITSSAARITFNTPERLSSSVPFGIESKRVFNALTVGVRPASKSSGPRLRRGLLLPSPRRDDDFEPPPFFFLVLELLFARGIWSGRYVGGIEWFLIHEVSVKKVLKKNQQSTTIMTEFPTNLMLF